MTDRQNGDTDTRLGRLRQAVTARSAAVLWPADAQEGFLATLDAMWPQEYPCPILLRAACGPAPAAGALGPGRPLHVLHAEGDVSRLCRDLSLAVLLAREREPVGCDVTWILTADEAAPPDMDDAALNATVLRRLRLLGYI